MIDINGAQVYFSSSNHHKSAIWSAFHQSHRIGAIASARRVLSRSLKRKLNDEEPEYKESDNRRDDFAVYEQSIWMLEHGQIADAGGSEPISILTGDVDKAGVDNDGVAGLYAPEALRWLGWSGASVIRG